MCEILTNLQSSAADLAPELTRAVTNVVCTLCFSSSYKRGDPEFEAMLKYSQGIVDTVAKDSLVDIFPWLQVNLSLKMFSHTIAYTIRFTISEYLQTNHYFLSSSFQMKTSEF